jgi:hypothetical protein
MSGRPDLHARFIVEHQQDAARFGSCGLDCPAGDDSRQFLVSRHNLFACSTGWGISAIEGFQLRHELALLCFTVKP